MVGKFSGDPDEEELQEALERFGGKNQDAFFYRAVCMDFVKRVFDEKNRQSVTQEKKIGFFRT